MNQFARIMIFAASIAGFAAISSARRPQDAADIKQAQALLDQKRGSLPPYFQSRPAFLHDLIGRYLKGDTMTESEAQMAIATLGAIGYGGAGDGIQSRDYKDYLKKVSNGEAGPSTVAGAPTTPVAGAATKPKFTAKEVKLPGRKQTSWVLLSIQGRKKPIIEIPGTRALSSAGRAAIIAKRMANVAASDPLWWMQLVPGTANREDVVKLRDAAGWLVTSNQEFARETGLTPSHLSLHIIAMIKSTMDKNAGGIMGARDAEPPSPRDQAIDLRQAGDEIVADDAAGAEAKYRAAIAADPTYGTAYARLIDLLSDRGRKADADKVRADAKSANMSPADRAALGL